jgi:2-polyprenyl-3-methyl-5-hydroxy-6-metoxy-1,4-benzoquinol methylase
MRLEHTSVFRCNARTCDLQFASPQLSDHELAQAYASLYYRPDGLEAALDNTPEIDVRHLIGRLAAQFGSPAGKRVLDYGCGVGTLMKVARELGAQVTGVEPSATARDKITVERFGAVYPDLEALRRAESEAKFDWIVLCEVVEHLRRPWDDLEQLRPLLAPGGEVILLTPNFDALRSRLSGARWEQRTNLTHFYYFTAHSLAVVLRKAGLAPRELRPVNWYSKHGFLRRQLQRVLAATGLQGSMMFAATAGEPLSAVEAESKRTCVVG